VHQGEELRPVAPEGVSLCYLTEHGWPGVPLVSPLGGYRAGSLERIMSDDEVEYQYSEAGSDENYAYGSDEDQDEPMDDIIEIENAFYEGDDSLQASTHPCHTPCYAAQPVIDIHLGPIVVARMHRARVAVLRGLRETCCLVCPCRRTPGDRSRCSTRW
jgi:hypothetical protein